MKKIIYAVVVSTILYSCGNSSTESNVQNETPADSIKTEPKEEVCKKGYDVENTSIGFGAFKTTERKEVKGIFTAFKVSNTAVADSPEEIFANASFQIPVESLETKDAGRNERVKEHFFGKMAHTNNIKGEVKAFNTDSNTVEITLNLNSIKKDIVFDYQISGDTISVSGSINIFDFDANESLEALNSVCESLHMGADGISKTWPDVNIYISSIIKETCK